MTESKDNVIVFVYGTLKRGGPNNYLMDSINAEYLGDAGLKDHALYGIGNLPVAVSEDNNSVYGEIWKVPSPGMLYLDMLENNGKAYTRKVVTVNTMDGNQVEAWFYEFTMTSVSNVPFVKKIESGVWDLNSEFGILGKVMDQARRFRKII